MTISIVIPVHNGESTLRRCRATVCASRYSDYECIVVDDGTGVQRSRPHAAPLPQREPRIEH